MRLPSFIHDANVAGLEQAINAKAKKKPVQRAPDNAPDAAWVRDRIVELEGDLPAQTALFEALPYDVQEQVWRLLETKVH